MTHRRTGIRNVVPVEFCLADGVGDVAALAHHVLAHLGRFWGDQSPCREKSRRRRCHLSPYIVRNGLIG